MSLDLLSILIVGASSFVVADLACFMWLRSLESRRTVVARYPSRSEIAAQRRAAASRLNDWDGA
jgi:hypothetical protein